MPKLSAHDTAELSAALDELRDHLIDPALMKATMDATPVGAMPPWLAIILKAAGPLLQQLGPLLVQQVVPILTQLLTTWLGGLTVPPVTPPGPKPPAIPNLPS